jgi:hypothetical protein
MSDITNAYIPPAALTGSMRDFRVPGGADLLGRTEGLFQVAEPAPSKRPLAVFARNRGRTEHDVLGAGR